MSTSTNNAVSVQDYIAGRMSDAEREAFEGRLLNDANLLRDLEESLRLREGLEVLREQKVLEDSRLAQRRNTRLRFAWALAGAAAAVLVSVTLYYGKHLPPVVGASVASLSVGLSPAPPVVERYAFAEMRAKDLTPELAVPPSGALELRALASVSAANGTFRVTLDQIQRQKILRVGVEEHVVPDPDGFVVIYANTARLELGEYVLTVERDSGQNPGEPKRFAFRLVRTPGAPGIRDP